MTALILIVKTLPEAAAALDAGADQAIVAGPIDAAGHLPARVRSRSIAFACDSTASPAASDLVGWAVREGIAALWLPVQTSVSDVVMVAQDAGLSVGGLLAPGDPFDENICQAAVTRGLAGFLIATPFFSGRRLIGEISISHLAAKVEQAHRFGLSIAFAGAVEPPDLPRLHALGPDAIGLDTVPTSESPCLDRAAEVSTARALMRPSSAALAKASPIRSEPDRILVHDWVVPMSIGAYARERGRAQRVRFNVEAMLDEASASGEDDIAAVVSYDLITDAIARLAAQHIDLVETVAERLAAAILAHPRVLAAEITVEKLEVGPGTVGCRITRTRQIAPPRD